MTDPTPNRRFSPTPSWLVLGLLVVEGLLWLSERYTWFWFNEKKGWTVLIGVAVVGGAMLVMLLWFLTSLLFRWRFQFSIRSLLVLTVAVAIPCSWMAAEMKAAKRQKEAVAVIVKVEGTTYYDYEVDSSGTFTRAPKPSQPEWLGKLLGPDFFADVVGVKLAGLGFKTTDSTLDHLKALGQLRALIVFGGEFTDAGLENLKGLKQLQGLFLFGGSFTDAGLSTSQGVPQTHVIDTP